MKPVKNARQIALRSYSMWLNRAAIAVVLGAEVRYILTGIDSNPFLIMKIWLALAIGVEIARYIRQSSISGPDLHSPALVMVAALFLAMGKPTIIDWPADAPTDPAPSYTTQEFLAVAVPLIRKWEGAHRCADRPKLHCSYLDTIADPPVWTACHGETRGITRGMRFTDAQCADMLAKRVLEFREGWRGYLTPETRLTRLHAPREAAFTSLAYNVGEHGAGRSTATRRLNAGDVPGACTAIGWWNKAGGRVVRGLVNRRTEEVALCRVGLT